MKIDKEEVFGFIMELDHYPTQTEVLEHFEQKDAEEALRLLLDEGSIIVDPRDDTVLVTRVTSKKLQDMLDRAVRVR